MFSPAAKPPKPSNHSVPEPFPRFHEDSKSGLREVRWPLLLRDSNRPCLARARAATGQMSPIENCKAGFVEPSESVQTARGQNWNQPRAEMSDWIR